MSKSAVADELAADGARARKGRGLINVMLDQPETPEQLRLRLETTAEIARLQLEFANARIAGNISKTVELQERAEALQKELDELKTELQTTIR